MRAAPRIESRLALDTLRPHRCNYFAPLPPALGALALYTLTLSAGVLAIAVEDGSPAADAGVDDFLSKPVEQDRLAALLARVVQATAV